jgi:hypothetical protein
MAERRAVGYRRDALVKMLVFGVTLWLAATQAAIAGLVEIDATAENVGVVTATDFSLVYDDISADGLLQLDELVSFSGFSLAGSGVDGFYTQIIGTPDIAGISVLSGTVIGVPGANWNFLQADGSGGCCVSSLWSYEESAAGASAPEPATLALLGLGLLGAGFARSRRLS